MRNSTRAAIVQEWLDQADEGLARCQRILAIPPDEGYEESAELWQECQQVWENIRTALKHIQGVYGLRDAPSRGQLNRRSEEIFLRELLPQLAQDVLFDELVEGSNEPELIPALEDGFLYLRLRDGLASKGQSIHLEVHYPRIGLPKPIVITMLNTHRHKYDRPKRKMGAKPDA